MFHDCCMQSEGGCMQSEGGCMQSEGGCMQSEGGCMQSEGVVFSMPDVYGLRFRKLPAKAEFQLY